MSFSKDAADHRINHLALRLIKELCIDQVNLYASSGKRFVFPELATRIIVTFDKHQFTPAELYALASCIDGHSTHTFHDVLKAMSIDIYHAKPVTLIHLAAIGSVMLKIYELVPFTARPIKTPAF